MFLFTSFVLFFIMIKSDPDQYKALVTDSIEDDDFIKEVEDRDRHSLLPPPRSKDVCDVKILCLNYCVLCCCI